MLNFFEREILDAACCRKTEILQHVLFNCHLHGNSLNRKKNYFLLLNGNFIVFLMAGGGKYKESYEGG